MQFRWLNSVGMGWLPALGTLLWAANANQPGASRLGPEDNPFREIAEAQSRFEAGLMLGLLVGLIAGFGNLPAKTGRPGPGFLRPLGPSFMGDDDSPAVKRYPGLDGLRASLGRGGPGDSRRMRALNWALSQVGISERSNPDTVRGYSRGRWQAWCADFVSTAMQNAGLAAWGFKSRVSDIWRWALANGKASRTPQAGDAVIYQKNGRPSHVALVKSVNGDGTITTVGGNESDAVRMRRVRLGSNILGFVSPC